MASGPVKTVYVGMQCAVDGSGQVVGKADVGPASVEPVGLVGPVAVGGDELLVEMGAEPRLHRLDVLLGDHAFFDQPLGVDFHGTRVRSDGAVHERLGESRLVRFVVAVLAVAKHVDHDRLLELLPELRGDLGDVHHGLGVVAVDVEDGRFDHLGHVRAIGRRARVARARGEADLVVDDEVDRPTRAVALEAG